VETDISIRITQGEDGKLQYSMQLPSIELSNAEAILFVTGLLATPTSGTTVQELVKGAVNDGLAVAYRYERDTL